MPQLPKARLGDMLVTAGVLSDEQLQSALEEQKQSYRRLGEILLDAKLVSDDDIAEAHALQMEMPYVELSDYPIPKDIASQIPETICRTYNLIPVSSSRERLAVAMSNPMDLEAIETVQRYSKKRVEPLLASESSIITALDVIYGGSGGADIMASIEEAISDVEVRTVDVDDFEDILEEKRQSGQAPIVKTVNLILQEAVIQRASDIHLEPRSNYLEIRYRIDGALRHIRNLPKQLQAAIISRIKIMAEMDIAEKRKPQDGRIALKIHNRNVDLRISSLPIQYGERVVIRVLDKSSQKFSIDQIGFNAEQQKTFESFIAKPYGIILVTGPTGSGKTTTLYSALNHLKSVETNVMTCEDPIEYELEGINQSAVNVRAGLTFAAQLRAILRQDPDIILVGEIRDHETAEIAFQAAMTGHLVLSTLHCNDAPSAITRLIDMEVEPFLIGSSVNGVVAQRLVRNLCPRCKEEYEPSPEDLDFIKSIENIDKVKLYRQVGCQHCNKLGFQGRSPIFELMPVTEQIRRLVVSRPSSDEVRELALKAGMKTMKQHAIEKLLEGVTTIEEVKKKVFVEDID